ncbi:MAG: NADH-quinone oxidoreductase subunit NuoN [Legionellaceae bacterium]|nr:NADH-quinone oxidoreductase subunit NuoN [Legionellaceae bacterium]
MTVSLPNFYCLVPEMAVLLGACLVLMLDVFVKQKEHLLTFWLTEAVVVVAAILTALQFYDSTIVTFHGNFIRDDFGSICKLFVYLIMFAAFYFSTNYISERKIHQGEYYALGLFSMLGMMILISGHSLITVYLGLELLSLPQYAMIAMQRDSDQAPEAAMKYFIMGAIASGILLYGMSMIYGAANSLQITQIGAFSHTAQGLHFAMLTFGILFLIVGIGFKLGAVPFHNWIPDVYQGSPVSVALIIGTATKIAGFGMAIRLLANMLPGVLHEWQLWLIVVSIASMAIGNLLAIVQTSFKRLLGYSSVAQMGYMLLGLLTGTKAGYSAATFYVIVYALMALAAFSLLTMLSRKGIEFDRIEDLKGLNSRNPWMAFMMLLIMFSMAGIPPLVGFFAKVAVFEALVKVHLVWVACVAVILAVIGAYYYIHVVKVMYFEEPVDATPLHAEGDVWVVFTLNSLLLLGLGIFPTALYALCSGLF